MDEQDTSQLNTNEKITSELDLQETEKEKIGDAVPEVEVHPVVYEGTGTENQVIEIVTHETDGEMYIYEQSEIENAPTESAAEYVQVCDSNNVFEDGNNPEDKDVNVDGLEEEEVEEVEKKETKAEDEKIEERKESAKTTSEGNLKNYKNVILEDWDVEVPQIVQNHDPEGYTETVVVAEEPSMVETHEEVTYNNENCVIEEVTVTNENAKESSPEKQNENLKPENLVVTENENSKDESALNEHSETPKDQKSVVQKENLQEGNSTNSQEINSINSQEENSKKENKPVVVSHVQNENSFANSNENPNVKDGITPQLVEKRLEALKYPKSVTKEEIVKILDDSSERVMRPIVGGKDLFFSIELTKRLNQKLSLNKSKLSESGEKHNESDSCNNNNTVDDRQKIVDILEADEIKDWKSVPSKSDIGPKENGNDMEISKAIKSMEQVDSKGIIPAKPPRKTPLKKIRTMDKELERTLALQQLREEFPSTRKRSRTSKKVNHVPFLASTVLEKAMTAPEVTTALKPGPPKRRPCYLPENVTYSKSKETVESDKAPETVVQSNTNEATKSSADLQEPDFEMAGKSMPVPVVKTYSAKRRSTDAESDIKTTLEAVAKALNESSEEVINSKPKKQKTVTKGSKNKILIKKKRKLKLDKKMNSELEKLLGDEGAVRMLYDTQHGEATAAPPKKTKFKTTTGLKKDLVLKTKLVKNAVMRLSGVGTTDGVFLRGKRRSNNSQVNGGSNAEEDQPLFTSTPNIVLYKPKKKQRAEASRILYRHSSSESFDSSEGYRRTSFDADRPSVEPGTSASTEDSRGTTLSEAEKGMQKGRAKKSEILKKRLKMAEEARQRKVGKSKSGQDRLSTDSLAAGSSKVNLSHVPVRKSTRPRMVSKKYSIWSSTSMDSLSVESLGLKKLKKASTELGKKLNCKELTIMQYEHLVQIVLTPSTTALKNSLNYEVLQELHRVFSYLSKDETCRVVLLSSRGSTFCQGIDISRIISFNEAERKKAVSQLVKAIRDFVVCLATFKKPVVAGVQGAAVGLGVTLLPFCDLILSSDTASYYTPYVKLGQAPEGAPIHTFPIINRHLVSELFFKSRKLTAVDAFKYGLVSQVVPEERFEEDLIMTSRNMASQPVQGMQSIKFLLRKSEQRDVVEALQAEGELLEEHWNSNECLSNMIKFLNSGELQLKHNATA